LVLVTS
jgi:arylsulfatase A-like enzyme